MASQPDAHPDSPPTDTPGSVEQDTPGGEPSRESVDDSPGDFAGTAGTGGDNKVQDQSVER